MGCTKTKAIKCGLLIENPSISTLNFKKEFFFVFKKKLKENKIENIDKRFIKAILNAFKELTKNNRSISVSLGIIHKTTLYLANSGQSSATIINTSGTIVKQLPIPKEGVIQAESYSLKKDDIYVILSNQTLNQALEKTKALKITNCHNHNAPTIAKHLVYAIVNHEISI